MPLKAEGEFALVRERLENALTLAGQPVKRGTMAHEHDVFMVLTDTAAQQYDAVALERYTPALEELAKRDNHRLYLAVAQRAQGIIYRLGGDHRQSEAELERALQIFDELGTHWQSGRTLVELGVTARARQNMDAARDLLTRALLEFETLGAAPDAARAQSILEELV